MRQVGRDVPLPEYVRSRHRVVGDAQASDEGLMGGALRTLWIDARADEVAAVNDNVRGGWMLA